VKEGETEEGDDLQLQFLSLISLSALFFDCFMIGLGMMVYVAFFQQGVRHRRDYPFCQDRIALFGMRQGFKGDLLFAFPPQI
jgi:hypothetical protein